MTQKKRGAPPKKWVRRVDTGELKFHDLSIDDAVIAINGNIAEDSCLTIPEGNGDSDRIGRKITVTNIGWRFSMNLPATATAADTSDIIRVILYEDKQCNGATAVVATNAGILAADDFESFNNLSNRKRFRILMDRNYAMKSMAGSGRGTTDTLSYGEDRVTDTFFKKVNIPIEYDNSVTTGAIESMRSSNIGVLLLSSNGHTGFNSSMRIRFLDH